MTVGQRTIYLWHDMLGHKTALGTVLGTPNNLNDLASAKGRVLE